MARGALLSRNSKQVDGSVVKSEDIAVLHARSVLGGGGGADKTTLNSPRYLHGSRYRAWAAFLHRPHDPGFQEIRQRAETWDCPLVPIPDLGLADLSALWRLYGLCRRLNVKIWHGHEFKTNVIGLLLRPFFRFRLVTTAHGWVEYSRKLSLYYKIDRWVLRYYDRVVTVSRDLYEVCLAQGVKPERLRLIENGVEVADYRRRCSAAQAPGRIGERGQLLTGRIVPKERLVIGAVGRLSPEKGFDLLIEAFSRLCECGLDVELWIAGEGGQEAALRKQVERAGCGDRIHLLGFCSDAVALFHCFDIFCLASLREGLPNVVLEAMAMKVPVLATRSGGISAVFRDGTDCKLVPPGSVETLEQGLLALIRDPEGRQALATHALGRVHDEFNFRRRMDKMIAVYDELIPI